ncbi:MAG: peptide deformylase [Actinomycetota bacterium]|nr:peptide deformylase [Actinomycetota bacterium]
MAPFKIRVFGDPVLRQPTHEVTEIDENLVRLAEDMLVTMYEAPGVGLAAPQVGIQKRFFVYDIGEGPNAVVNPRLSDHDGEWTYEEGCLSVPELSWPIVRYERVHLDGLDLSGAKLSIDADELLARMFQHECDHLDGMLLLERLDKRQRKGAMRALRQRALGIPEETDVSVDSGATSHAQAPDETASVTQ